MKPSIFKIAVGITILGMIWLGIIFNEADKTSASFFLKPEESSEIKMQFFGNDIGYYTIFIPEFSGKGVYVQVLDERYNVITDGLVETKMSVSYFEFNDGGTYLVKITNISNNPINLEVEFGDTNGREMVIPGFITLMGGLMVVGAFYIKLRDYRIAQPDENIS